MDTFFLNQIIIHGGAAIYIKSSLMFHSVPNFCQPYLQSCASLLYLNNTPTTIAAIYSPPKHNINIQNYVDYFSTLSHNFIIGGDYNTKHTNWGCRTNNFRGMVLHNFTNLKATTSLLHQDQLTGLPPYAKIRTY